MSIFPAYEDPQPGTSDEQKSWLTNSSFAAPPPITGGSPDNSDEDSVVEIADDVAIPDNDDPMIRKPAKKAKKHKEKTKKKKRNKSPEPKIEFTGNEEYYVDKNSIAGYLSVETLHKPACPRYRITSRTIGHHKSNFKKSTKRYFKKVFSEIDGDVFIQSNSIMTEEEFTNKTGEFNRKFLHGSKDVDLWIAFINHQNNAPIKLTKTQLAERKLEILEKALIHNFGDEKLYKVYVDIIDSTYPSFEVTKFLDKLLAKDPTNYVLWAAQIFAIQGSMARCIVPDVLKLYENCMQKMYRKSQQDEIMLKLFNNCGLFLRQSGLSEQFFALIKLALELNVSTNKFQEIQPSEKDQQTLIEYEEVILKSGLPMNEIWLRIEKIRQNYNFLPCPPSRSCSDPQRIVFNEDICYFIYPLAQKENCFALIVIILRLVKIPISPYSSSMKNRFLFKAENLNEFDSIEDILAVCLHRTTNLFANSLNFDLTLFELVKEMISGPSYLNTNIGYEIYLNTIIEILLLCAECFTHDERKRTIFVLIWLRFERILLILEKFSSKLSNEYVKKIKSKVKNLLKKDENRNVLNFYTEYALIECEFGNLHVAENIFVTSISQSITDKSSHQEFQVSKADFCHAHVTYAEILLKEKNYIKAMKVLTCYALDISLDELDGEVMSEPRKLLALRKLTERFNDLIFIEKNVQIMELEQYFLPDYLVSLLKVKTYYQILLNAKLEAMAYLDNLLRHFAEKNPRHSFVRENIYELYLNIMSWHDKTCSITNLLIYETLARALSEFPENLIILRTCAALDNQPWYKIRSLLLKTNSPVAVIFLITSARYRFTKFHNSMMVGESVGDDDGVLNPFAVLSAKSDSIETSYKIRVMNILKCAVDKKSALRKNSLMWRLYLRSLSDLQKPFERSRNALFAALDECPWDKALYLDGSVFVPQELPQIQDLIIEKQLRIYALPEELEILRNDDFKAPSENQ